MEVDVTKKKREYIIYGTAYTDLEDVLIEMEEQVAMGNFIAVLEYLFTAKRMAVEAEERFWDKIDEVDSLEAELASLESAFNELNTDYEALMEENQELQRMVNDVQEEV
jgi:predicted nuclease with TOPRIM domain